MSLPPQTADSRLRRESYKTLSMSLPPQTADFPKGTLSYFIVDKLVL